MPIYEFKCADCESIHEFTMKFSDPNPETCPSCGANKLSKIMSMTSFQLKGGGWYKDAYDRKPSKSDDASTKETKSDESGGETKKSETKTETKTETKSETSKPSKPKSSKAKSASK